MNDFPYCPDGEEGDETEGYPAEEGDDHREGRISQTKTAGHETQQATTSNLALNRKCYAPLRPAGEPFLAVGREPFFAAAAFFVALFENAAVPIFFVEAPA